MRPFQRLKKGARPRAPYPHFPKADEAKSKRTRSRRQPRQYELAVGRPGERMNDADGPSERTMPSEAEVDESVARILSTARECGTAVAVDDAFDELDLGNTGHLTRSDVQAFMSSAARHTKLATRPEDSVVEAAVDALIHDAGGGEAGDDSDRITREQFRGIFARHPDMLTVFEDEEGFAAREESVRLTMSGRGGPSGPDPSEGAGGIESALLAAPDGGGDDDDDETRIQEDEEVWVHELATHWKNRWSALLWLVVYAGGNAAVVSLKAIKYARHENAQAVFGNCIVVARGCAAALNLNACLVLLAMCRHVVTLLRRTPLRSVFPFDAIQEIHVMIGIVFALFAASHTAAHICDFHRFGLADEDDIERLFGDRVDPPDSYAGRWRYMLGTRAGITVVIMAVCLTVSYSFAFDRRKHFNRFWYTHHLLLVMLVCLCIHGTGNLLEPFQSLYWVIGPLVLYAVPRIWRESPLSAMTVEKMAVKKGDVVQLRLRKPKWFHWMGKAGMYGFLNVPEVSRLEWHPFTISSAPRDDYVEFHFRRVGKWTGKVHDLLAARADEADPTGIKDAPVVKVEGPIGASSQDFVEHSIVVLVAAGIGVTPMISVLKHLLADPGRVRRCFFYWTVRDRDSFMWFTDLMDEVFESDKKNMLQIRHFLTSVKHDDRDLGAVLLHHATRAHHRRTSIDLLLGQQVHHQVEVGRPDWEEELESVREEAVSLGERECGVFLCGPKRMGEAVYEATVDVSVRDQNFHMYFSKETF